ncbi:MAG TPA: sigma-54 dependent transcriptional regulator [Vicinamibacterales bacterium]|nr:sigma-54 dependent transcriptional regulator [Vicinamibacterales bacterium]
MSTETLRLASQGYIASTSGSVAPLLGQCPEMARVHEDIRTAARSDAKVLVVGETGVGKEIVARLIHESGARQSRNFVAINCAGLPDSLLESELFGHVRGSFTGAYRDKPGLAVMAHRGTLFLDELGEMSLRMQAMLLRFVETGEIQRVGSDRSEGHVDVRIIAATNRNLLERINEKEFREDLYYRLNVIRLVIPPLRERGGDVALLLQHYLQESARAHRVEAPRMTPAAQEILSAYRWPGNVRELKNVVERLVIRQTGGEIGPDDLPEEIVDRKPFAEANPVLAAEPAAKSRAEVFWDRMVVGGESFWTVVYPAFIDRELTKTDLRQLIKAGLQQTQGSYRKLVELFRMAPGDYKRFLAFLYQHDCHLPFHGFRDARSEERSVARGA